MRFPLFSGRRAISPAAKAAAPPEIPISNPSSRASCRAVSYAASSETVCTSSTTLPSYILGIKPAPMPCILCAPAFPPDNTGDFAGSTAMVRIAGSCFFNPRDVPVSVPPVPTVATKMSKRPSVSFQISYAVVCSCARGFASFSNCCRMTAPAISPRSCSALRIAPDIPSAPGVSTMSAP